MDMADAQYFVLRIEATQLQVQLHTPRMSELLVTHVMLRIRQLSYMLTDAVNVSGLWDSGGSQEQLH